MISYSDYRRLYGGGLSGEDFARLLPEAEAAVHAASMGRLPDSGGRLFGITVRAVCACVQALARFEQPLRVANDGCVLEYAQGSASRAEILRSAAVSALSGTGLLSAL